jgi:potassium-transporting ATPase KdpC subunit
VQSLRLTLVFTTLVGLGYPLAVTGVAQAVFHRQANGSVIERDSRIIGSEWLAQTFQSPRYFWPRPSSSGYATVPSGASNSGPTSRALQSNAMANASAFVAANRLAPGTLAPADMVFASGSGLDPHISPEAAHLQVERVAAARGVSPKKVDALVAEFVEPPQFGFLGERRVNVLLLNVAVDAL